MVKSNKAIKKILFKTISFLICLILTYCYGILTIKYRLFPYSQLKFLYETLQPPQEINYFQYSVEEQYGKQLFEKRQIRLPYSFIVFGDSREPHNWHDATGFHKEFLINHVSRQKVNFIINLGDMVTCGDWHYWKIFDLFYKPIKDSGIPFYPVLGNHEYHTIEYTWPKDPTPQLTLFFDRFPILERNRWYSFIYGNSLFIFLDTNTEYFEGTYQYNWLINLLESATSENIFIFTHHPPYTKSIYGRRLEKSLADLFENNHYRKPDIVFSGHVHDYEHYIHQGIHYVVSGGGGAELHGTAPHHYLKLTVFNDKIECVVWAFKNKQWIIYDSWVIKK